MMLGTLHHPFCSFRHQTDRSFTWTESRRSTRKPILYGREQKRVYARPLSWDIPKPIFPRPPNFFPRPERLLDGVLFKEFILQQEEAVKDFPWEYIILFSFVALIILQFVIKPFNGKNSVDEGNEEDEEELKSRYPKTEEEKAIFALKKMEFQAERNRSLLFLGGTAVLFLWLAGFLNTPHPFEP